MSIDKGLRLAKITSKQQPCFKQNNCTDMVIFDKNFKSKKVLCGDISNIESDKETLKYTVHKATVT